MDGKEDGGLDGGLDCAEGNAACRYAGRLLKACCASYAHGLAPHTLCLLSTKRPCFMDKRRRRWLLSIETAVSVDRKASRAYFMLERRHYLKGIPERSRE